jgi:PAS domain S-box-containing protein
MIAILCVDDDQNMLELCQANLDKPGELEIVCVRSVPEALALMSQREFAVIVADYRMPGMDGLQMLKLLRGQGNEVPFILFTGQGREEIVIEAINSGADYYIQKGTNSKILFAELAHRLEKALMTYRMRRDLRESEELFRTMSDKANDAILLCAKDGRITFHNLHASALLGLESRQVPFPQMVEIADRYEIDLSEAFAHGSTPIPDLLEATVQRDGHPIYVEMSISPIHVHGQDRYMVIVRDITERIQAQKEMSLQLTELYDVTEVLGQTTKELRHHEAMLRDANRELNLLQSITRHDILNQMTGLTGYLELCRKEPLSPRASMYLERMSQAAENIRKQIEFTRIYKGLGTQLPIWQDPGVAMLQASTSIHMTTPEINLPGIEVMADPLLAKVFLNLLENSSRHGGGVTHISLMAEEGPDGALRIIYQDNGKGIPDADLEKIFQRSYGKDAGLGLFLSKEILALTNLDLVARPSPVKGARFEIIVPPNAWRKAEMILG